MNKLNLDALLISQCRKDAREIADDVQAFIDRHSTVSVERAVCRLLGIDGTDQIDVPLVNVVVEHAMAVGDITKGISGLLAQAVLETRKSPQEIARMIASKTLSFKDLKGDLNSPPLSVLDPYFDQSFKIINAMSAHREQMMSDMDDSEPAKYVIVATGNIYEDIKQAVSAAMKGADIIAVIRSTGQSLLDYVPYGATTEGFGGTYATQENFKLMRKALDDVSKTLGRYVRLVNYASGLCMPEIAAMGALERLDMMLNDSLYGIIFRDINMQRTFVDQYFSRVLSAYAGITINTGEDNYLTTSDAFLEAHTVLASQFINEQFATKALMHPSLMGLGHAFEIDPMIKNSFLYEIAQAQMAREIFPEAPLKYMPPTKHMTGDIFKGTLQNTMFNMAAVATKQSIHLLGMMTEAIHTPFVSDRAHALDYATVVATACHDLFDEITFKEDGIIMRRAHHVLREAASLLQTVKKEGMFETLAKGTFAGIKRHALGGKGLSGVFEKAPGYQNPVLDRMQNALKGVSS
ncbi:MAG: lysine 5,6-aminomutase subunit alpha [Acholeplasmataceae bacterium]|nr:lysine 5,6-aminomutase subunit alpha [Acholeplasmataceae bacterium]